MASKRLNTKVPQSLQGVLWSVDVNDLDLEKHKGYIIHQVLVFGTVDQIKWLFSTYSRKQVVDVFLKHPARMYPRIVFHFVKNFILRLENISLSEERYVTSISGPLRQRASGGFSQT